MDRSPRVSEILSWYGADSPGTLTNLARMLEHGKLGGTGKMLILPVDQGFEHGPARTSARTRRPTIRTTISNWPWRRAATPTRRRSASSRREPGTMPGGSR